ncbi:MAG: hypothetical protein LBL45_12080 [Treponema sp.]|nr:hypothetical protein [Treponema sp.]
MRKLAPLYIVLLAGCLSAQTPAAITEWINRHQGDYMFGMGISTKTDEAEACQQAKSFALAELAASIEAHITAAAHDFKSAASSGGDAGRAEQFSTGTMSLANQVIKMTQVYGPVMNKENNLPRRLCGQAAVSKRSPHVDSANLFRNG